MEEALRWGGSLPDGAGGGYSTGMSMVLMELKKEVNMSLDLCREGGAGNVVSGGGSGKERRAFRTDVKMDKAVGRLPCLA